MPCDIIKEAKSKILPVSELTGFCLVGRLPSKCLLFFVTLSSDARAVLFCSELLVGALIPNRRDDYGPRVVLAKGTCKHVNTNFNRQITELVVRILKKGPRGEQLRGPLSTTQS